jgi:hypothetical protein
MTRASSIRSTFPLATAFTYKVMERDKVMISGDVNGGGSGGGGGGGGGDAFDSTYWCEHEHEL